MDSDGGEDDDQPWMAFFVRKTANAAIVFLDGNAKAARDAGHAIAAAATKARWETLTADEQATEDLEARTFAQQFVPNLVAHILALLDGAVQVPEAGDRRLVAPLLMSLAAAAATNDLDEHNGHNEYHGHSAHRFTLPWMVDGVAQARCYTQRNNGACGYFSLHNGLVVCNAVLAKHTHGARACLNTLTAGPLFWQQFWQWNNHLVGHAHARGNRGGPWLATLVREGIMERAHMALLVTSLNHQYQPRGANFLAVPECVALLDGTGHNLALINEVDAAFAALAAARNHTLVVVLGLVNHWVSVVINKIEHDIELIVLNSSNNRYVDVTDDEAWEVVQVACDARRRRGKPLTQTAQLLYFQQITEGRHCVCQLAALARGGVRTLHARFVCRGTERVLDSFEAAFGPPAPLPADFDCDAQSVELSAWLSSAFHPRQIEELTVERLALAADVDGAGHWRALLGEATTARLHAWVAALIVRCATPGFARAIDNELPFLARVLQTVAKLQCFLAT